MRVELYQPQAIYEVGQRKNQEDSIYPLKGEATPDQRIFIVCDGMGGHEQGEVASAAVCEALARSVTAMFSDERPFCDDDFMKALQQAYDALDEADTKRLGRMGTTMTFLCMHRGGCMVAHLGDSRIYHLRPRTGEVLFRSRDHSLVQQFYEEGEISYNEMATHPRKNIITKALLPWQGGRETPSITHITDIQPDDYFYLCSDGMLEKMEDDELLAIVGGDGSDEEKVARLLELTKDNADNHSAYLLHVKAVESEPQDEGLLEDERAARAENKALNDTRKDEVWSAAVDEEPSSDDVEVVEPVAPAPPVSYSQYAAPKKDNGNKKTLWFFLFALCLLAAVIFFVIIRKGDKPAQQDPPKTEKVGKPAQAVQPAASQEASDEDEMPKERKLRPAKEPDKPSPSPDEAMSNASVDDSPETIQPQ